MRKKSKNKERLRCLGLFGGTFNPIHIGHIKMAEAARKEYKLTYIYFIPCGIPPHKQKNKLLPAKLRYDLVKKAIKKKKYFKVLDIEIRKKKKCYTVDTIKELEMSLRGGQSPTKQSRTNSLGTIGIASSPLRAPRNDSFQLFFLIGQDEFEKLHTWNKANELAKMLIFLILPRGKKRKINLPKIKNLKWKLVHTKPVNVSSSEIRERLIGINQ